MEKQKYLIEDVSVIIPTYERFEDLKTTIDQMRWCFDQIKELIVVDQSKTDKTRIYINELINKYGNKVKYIYSQTPSITIARNKGIKNANGRIICFIDDDVIINKNYFEEIIKAFNEKPELKAIAAWKAFKLTPIQKIINIMRGVLLINNNSIKSMRILSPYCNLYPCNPDNYTKAEWLPGMNMCFKANIFKELQFDENLLGYTLAEDIDMTYSLHKLYPGSIALITTTTILHNYSLTGRSDLKKLAYINQVDHFYFAMKHDMQISWLYNIIGLTFLKILALPFQPAKSFYYLQSLYYVLSHQREIKQGKVREWMKYIT